MRNEPEAVGGPLHEETITSGDSTITVSYNPETREVTLEEDAPLHEHHAIIVLPIADFQRIATAVRDWSQENTTGGQSGAR